MAAPLREFTLEAREHLAAFEQALLALESEPQAGLFGSHVDRALRAIHSLKGDAGFLGLMAIRDLAHAMETLLENSRREAGRPPSLTIETLLAARDQLTHLVEQPHQPLHPGWESLWQRLNPAAVAPSPALGTTAPSGQSGQSTLRALEFRVDLTRFSGPPSTNVPGFLRALSQLGTLAYCRMEPSGENLSAPLTPAPLWWHARLVTPLSAAELQARWPDLWSPEEIREADPRQVLAIDLDAACEATGLPLTALLSRLAQLGGLKNPRLEFPPTNFTAGLPLGPVWLHGERPAKIDPAVWVSALKDLPQWQSQWSALAESETRPHQARFHAGQPQSAEASPPVDQVPGPAPSREVRRPAPLRPPEPDSAAFGQAAPLGPDGRPSVSASTPVGSSLSDRPRVAPPTPQPGSATPSAQETNSGLGGNPPGAAAAVEVSRTEALRVRVELLDRLVDLVGELTLVRNQTLQAFDNSPANRALIQRLSGVTSQLQEAVLKTRLQPVGSLFGRFPRLIRDLSRQLGKQVELVTEGTAVELDKTVLELLSDPLNHLVRNSLDHGFETPEERLVAGKPATGRLTLAATPADGQVVLEIRDDGRGIDPERVRAKALALGWKTAAELDRLPPRDLLALVLQPGFSTARQVTEISGRGVGLDVVRTNVEQLDGSLTIDSIPGQGTAIRLRVPLTMAILPCLLVRVAGERFLIPQRDLEEIACLRPDGPTRIETAHRTEMYRLRGRLLPVVRYAELLGLAPMDEPAETASEPPEAPAGTAPAVRPAETAAAAGAVTVVRPMVTPAPLQHLLVVRARGTEFALVVDEVLGTQEVVVKPLHPALRRLGVYGGAALLGDGRVALIASLEGIARRAGVLETGDDSGGGKATPAPGSAQAPRDPRDVHRVLLFESGPDERFALPLVQIRRLVMVDPTRIERIQEAEFLTVDGVSTRVITLNSVLSVSPAERVTPMFLLLPQFVSEPFGILASRIIDTDTLMVDLQPPPPGHPGILGSALIRDRMTLFLHLQHIREQVFGGVPQAQSRPERERSSRVLLIDDTAFFREVVRRYLEAEGWSVETAVDGHDGLARLREERFDLIICDIEMPGLDGWGVARQARELGYRLPLLALTSLSKREHEARARDCGFDEFEEKLNHDRLIATVRRMLANIGPRGGASREERP